MAAISFLALPTKELIPCSQQLFCIRQPQRASSAITGRTCHSSAQKLPMAPDLLRSKSQSSHNKPKGPMTSLAPSPTRAPATMAQELLVGLQYARHAFPSRSLELPLLGGLLYSLVSAPGSLHRGLPQTTLGEVTAFLYWSLPWPLFSSLASSAICHLEGSCLLYVSLLTSTLRLVLNIVSAQQSGTDWMS